VSVDVPLRRDVPLASLTTLELGGPARYFVDADDERTIVDAARWAREQGVRFVALGSGSNIVAPDAGLDALVVRVGVRGIDVLRARDEVLVTACAGEPWDSLVEHTVAAGLAGIECLSGIPGLTGATPIQNVGAYGQEVSQTIRSLRVLDRESLEIGTLGAADCQFAYRSSELKRWPARWVVLAVTFALRPGGEPALRYAELTRALALRDAAPSLVDVRETVLALRRAKSMVIDAADENRRSVGSFFTNPIVGAEQARGLGAHAVELGLVRDVSEVPAWPEPDGRVKLAAGWLVERSGTARGTRAGAVGVSSRHALALVHHGGGTSTELLALAERVRARVLQVFGVELALEPVVL